MASSRKADLAALQQWIDRCRITYMHAPYSTPEGQHLGDLSEAIHGKPTSNSTERIRQLLASGAFWSGLQTGPSSDANVPRNIAIGIATDALWALVVVGTNGLPTNWLTELNNLTDLPVAQAVARAMHLDTDKLDLARSLGNGACAFGLGRLFDDLADPARSGYYVNALGSAYSDARVKPFTWIAPTARFVAVAAAAGIIGNRSDAIFLLLKDSLIEPMKDAKSQLFEELNRQTRGNAGSSVSGSTGKGPQRSSNDEEHRRPPPRTSGATGTFESSNAETPPWQRSRSSNQGGHVRNPPPRTPGGAGSFDSPYTETPPWQRSNQGDTQSSRPIVPPLSGTPDFDRVPSGSYSTERVSDPDFHNNLASHGSGAGISGFGHGTSNGTMMDLLNMMAHDIVVFFSPLFS